jgi:hypothetical protein
MRSVMAGWLAALLLVGCAATPKPAAPPKPPPIARDVGRVIVYPTGGAYVERIAMGPAEVRVRKAKLPELVRSLSAIDVATGEALPVAVPSEGPDGVLSFQIGTEGRRVRLAYVTEAPSWKSSYRLVLLPSGKLDVQGWATVENTSVEDWSNVRVGVGSRPTLAANETAGEAHFEPTRATTVPHGTSAMVPLFHAESDGESVHVLDPAAMQPLRAIRFRNPMMSVLEPGPVSIFGDGKWIGDGVLGQVGKGSIAFVPFALEREITTARQVTERNEVARVGAVTQGVVHLERRDVRATTITLKNAHGERTTVFVKHVVSPGYKLHRFPDDRSPAPGASDASDHLADTSFFRTVLEPNAANEIIVEEAKIAASTFDLRTPEGRAALAVYLADKKEDVLRSRLEPLLAMDSEIARLRAEASKEQVRVDAGSDRIAELRGQLATLAGMKDASALRADLAKRIRALEDEQKKALADVERIEQRLTLASVELQTAAGDITL